MYMYMYYAAQNENTKPSCTRNKDTLTLVFALILLDLICFAPQNHALIGLAHMLRGMLRNLRLFGDDDPEHDDYDYYMLALRWHMTTENNMSRAALHP